MDIPQLNLLFSIIVIITHPNLKNQSFKPNLCSKQTPNSTKMSPQNTVENTAIVKASPGGGCVVM
ncbi:uncharacterized protein ACLA_075430 [Aspergillus clavatus NRRL 1]|uniref:Uncharacterized protein n=1 Tax=Aspergillus clavatus (strain ATCC 1007 / CBS 513.65 / DSM 816 / NCTC 3887 / NRRL 1 / QM 1276 / 107) TaxID=344612 RepID=A1C7Y3_ASPCL|nr:uncharacterized protein ACLA_075430 [Aspergillus clavatus NRRL 1]EAW14504.1 hypothetical protein ACLA_075430 [Aspergillus clavatus NRRL 1]